MGALERINNKIRVASTLGFEPWPHWWEADAPYHCATLATHEVLL